MRRLHCTPVHFFRDALHQALRHDVIGEVHLGGSTGVDHGDAEIESVIGSVIGEREVRIAASARVILIDAAVETLIVSEIVSAIGSARGEANAIVTVAATQDRSVLELSLGRHSTMMSVRSYQLLSACGCGKQQVAPLLQPQETLRCHLLPGRTWTNPHRPRPHHHRPPLLV
jgi:hypothetical protein